jgi:gustatory receptor
MEVTSHLLCSHVPSNRPHHGHPEHHQALQKGFEFLFSSRGSLIKLSFSHADELTPATFHSAVFYITATLSCFIFITVDWRRFFFEWSRVENIFFGEKYKHAPTCITLKRKVLLCFFIGALAFVLDQGIFIASEVRKTIHLVEVCNFTKSSLFEDVIVFQLDQIFDFIPYNHVFGVTAEFFDLAESVYWTFPDIFIMLLSIGISHRFQQINKRIEFFRSRIISNELWSEVRSHYTEVCELVKIVNKTFDKLFVLATINNAYLMLVQMLHILA